MSERGLHSIEDDLAETWLEDWAGAGVAEIEDFLSKHAARTEQMGRGRESGPCRTSLA